MGFSEDIPFAISWYVAWAKHLKHLSVCNTIEQHHKRPLSSIKTSMKQFQQSMSIQS